MWFVHSFLKGHCGRQELYVKDGNLLNFRIPPLFNYFYVNIMNYCYRYSFYSCLQIPGISTPT